VRATSVGDGVSRDALLATTTCVATYRPDALIYNGAAFLGDGIYNVSGADQTHAADVALGRIATYTLRFYNDGTVAQSVLITGTPGNSKWTVQYTDVTAGTDITAAVTGAGWVTPSLPPRGYRAIKVHVTPGPSVAVNGSLSVLVTATSSVDPASKDAVKAITSRK